MHAQMVFNGLTNGYNNIHALFLFLDVSRASVSANITELVDDLPAENKALLMYLLEHLYRSE